MAEIITTTITMYPRIKYNEKKHPQSIVNFTFRLYKNGVKSFMKDIYIFI